MSKLHRWGMIIAFVVISVCAVIGIKTVFVEDRGTKVPQMVGMQLSDAADALQKQGLLAKIDKIDSTEPADTVISQSMPADEQVTKGKVVILRVSRGGAVTEIPDVRGMNFGDGIKRLGESGFKVNSVLRVTDRTKPAGSIIAQNPEAPQQVAANCMVSLLVSIGAKRDSSFVNVPDIRGQTKDFAKQVLEQAGLVFGGVSEIPSSSVPVGSVVSTNPRSGAKIPAGASVSVTLASAPKANEPASDEPPANDESKTRAEAVRTVVVKNTTPSVIPSKIPDKTVKPTKTQQKTGVKADGHPVAAVSADSVKKEEPKPAQQKTEQTEPKTQRPHKTAKIRYQVPPLTKPLSLKIEITDSEGTRVLRNTMAKSNEYVSINAPYTGEAKITIFLGGDFVWQDRFD